MGHFGLTQLVVLLFVWLLYKQVTNWVRSKSLKKWGKQYGCDEPPSLPNKLPGGLERYGVLFTGFKGMFLFPQQPSGVL